MCSESCCGISSQTVCKLGGIFSTLCNFYVIFGPSFVGGSSASTTLRVMVGVIGLISCGLLIAGAEKRNHSYFLPWIFVSSVQIAFLWSFALIVIFDRKFVLSKIQADKTSAFFLVPAPSGLLPFVAIILVLIAIIYMLLIATVIDFCLELHVHEKRGPIRPNGFPDAFVHKTTIVSQPVIPIAPPAIIALD